MIFFLYAKNYQLPERAPAKGRGPREMGNEVGEKKVIFLVLFFPVGGRRCCVGSHLVRGAAVALINYDKVI